MKKAIGIVVLTITLFMLIDLLVLNITVKKMLDDFVQSSWKSIIDIPQFKESSYIDNSISPTDVINQSEDILNDVLNNIDDYSNEQINDIINNNRDRIKEMTGIDVSGDMINDIGDAIKNKDYEKIIDTVANTQENKLNSKQRFIFKIFQYLATTRLRNIIIICIVLNVIALALIYFSFYEWIKSLAWALVLSGLSLLGFGHLIQSFLNGIKFVSISMDSIIHIAITLLIIGVVIIAVYFVIGIILKNKNNVKGKKKHAIS